MDQQLTGYAQISAETTEADFLSGRTGFALGFDSTNQTMVELWSEGFQLNSEQLTAAEELGRYCQAREQLALYMQEKILQEYVRYGGAAALCGWYDRAMTERRALLLELGARAVAVRQGKLSKPGCGYVAMDRFLTDPRHTIVEEAIKPDPEAAASAPTLGSLHVSPAAVDHVCAITGEASILTVKFSLDHWEEMELVLGEELPPLLKGWQRFRLPIKHRSKARYDPVGMVGTPIEHCVQARYQDQRQASEAAGLNLAQETQYLSFFDPSISIGFSEKGLLKIWKKLGI